MHTINTPLQIGHKEAPNRILMPPLVCFNWANEQGYETVSRADHYGKRAAGGTGTIVIEATAISPQGRIIETELGLWEDGHIEQFQHMAAACHVHGSLALVQLVHAGMKATGDKVYSASPQKGLPVPCEAMTTEHIHQVKDDFVKAALRAKAAGLDGVEIHGAHGYLLNQFSAPKTNRRTDDYGGSPENRMRFALEVTTAVREAVGSDFIIAYRFGVNDPTFEEDIQLAKRLERAGVDLLDVSAGIGYEEMQAPKDFPYHAITWMGVEMRKHVSIPVASVFGIRLPEEAHDLVETQQTDMVAVGRALLADPNWPNKAFAGEPINICYHCSPRCKYAVDGHTCPWYA